MADSEVFNPYNIDNYNNYVCLCLLLLFLFNQFIIRPTEKPLRMQVDELVRLGIIKKNKQLLLQDRKNNESRHVPTSLK